MTETRDKMDDLADKIRRHLSRDPENFADREPMWMEREALRRKHLNR